MQLTLIILLLMTSISAHADYDYMAQWGKAEDAFKKRDSDKLSEAIEALRKNAKNSTDGKEIVKLIGEHGEFWQPINDIDQMAKKVMKLLKLCDTFVAQNSLEDLKASCEGGLYTELDLLKYKVYVDEDELLKPFNEKITALTEEKRNAKAQELKAEQQAQLEEDQAKKAAQEKAENDPKTWLDRACGNLKDINFLKGQIDDEKDAAKHSGVVNKSKLYGLGQAIKLKSEILESQKKHYKEKSKGKTWSPSLCK